MNQYVETGDAQASSLKPQASSLKPQASSLKPQVNSLKGLFFVCQVFTVNYAKKSYALVKAAINRRRVSWLGVIVLGLMVQVVWADSVYVANRGSSTVSSNTVSVIDTTNNNVIATVTVGNSPTGVAANLSGTRVYVANNDSVSVIDTSTNSVVATVPIANNPTLFDVVVNPSGTRVYAVGSPNISVIDTNTNSVIATVPIGSNANPFGTSVAINPSGTRLYVGTWDVSNPASNTVYVMDTSTNKVVASVLVVDANHSNGAVGVAINPSGTRVYATSSLNTVTVIDTSTNSMVTTVPVGTNPFGLVVNPSGARVYVTSDNSISVIDTNTNSVVATIPVGAADVAINPSGTRIYAAGSNSVSIIDTSTNSVVATVPVGTNPISVAVIASPPTSLLTVAKVGNGTVTSVPTGIDCGNSCTKGYALNTVVTLTATPANANWSGCDSVTGNQCKVTLTADKTVTVAFTSNVTCFNNPNPATYDTATKVVSIPFVDAPSLDTFTGLPTGEFAVFSGQLKLLAGIDDFKINSLTFIKFVSTYDTSHARYDWQDSWASIGGKLTLCVDVPEVVVIPGVQVPTSSQRFEVILRQLAVDPNVFHIESMTKAIK